MTSLSTQRLVLRQWQESDYLPFSAMNADSDVMRYFPAVLSVAESDALARRLQAMIDKNGWGFWAVELKLDAGFIGFVGLKHQDSDIPEAPFIEIGWRLAARHWGKGYAPEAAKEALRFAFAELDTDAVYAFTPLLNQPSRRVMAKVGMQNTGLDFNYPGFANNHPLERHCLYKVARDTWREKAV